MTLTRKPRADAESNRRRIVEVARAAFAADGLDLPVREIARRAGMGVATVYRHFPSRQDLISAVLAEQVARCGEEMRAALADPDPRRALRGTIVRFGERQVRDRGLNQALLGSHAAGTAFTDQRHALIAIASFPALPTEQASTAIRRLTDLLLCGVLQD